MATNQRVSPLIILLDTPSPEAPMEAPEALMGAPELPPPEVPLDALIVCVSITSLSVSHGPDAKRPAIAFLYPCRDGTYAASFPAPAPCANPGQGQSQPAVGPAWQITLSASVPGRKEVTLAVSNCVPSATIAQLGALARRNGSAAHEVPGDIILGAREGRTEEVSFVIHVSHVDGGVPRIKKIDVKLGAEDARHIVRCFATLKAQCQGP